MLVNYHADRQTFKLRPRPAQEFLFWTLGLSLTARAEAMARHISIGESCRCHKLLLNPSNSLFEVDALSWVKRHEPNRLFRPQKLVGASSKSTTKNLLKLFKMRRLLMRVEKRLMVLSLVREPIRRNIQHLKDYPVFKVFFFVFRMLAVSWCTRYACAQRAELCDSCTACARVETSKARVPRYEPQIS